MPHGQIDKALGYEPNDLQVRLLLGVLKTLVIGYNRSQEFCRMKPIEFIYYLSGVIDAKDGKAKGLTAEDVSLIESKLNTFVKGGEKQAPKGLQ